MAKIPASLVKELRDKTGISIMECKKALEACEGDIDKAIEWLRKKGLEMAKKRQGRSTNEGIIDSYIHAGGRIGVLLELACETDFVARTEDFKKLAHELCLQIAAMAPQAIRPEDLPKEVVEKEKEIYREQMKDKPKDKLEKIIEGKLKKFYKEVCLLHQPYFRDEKQTVADLIKSVIAKVGENIEVKRFVRFEVGES